MKVVSIANQKGGVAKTTTASVLSSGLFNRGYRVLAVDLDPQCNLSFCCNANFQPTEKNLYHVFKKQVSAEDILQNSSIGFDILSGGLDLAGADIEFTSLGKGNMLILLAKAIVSIKNNYDFIIIDTPPTLGILTANALMTSDLLIVPMNADIFSLQGLSQLSGFIHNVYKNGNHNLKIAGLLLTKYKARQNLTKALAEQIEIAASQLDTKVFNSKIREGVAVRETALLQNNIFTSFPKANVTVDYNNFINEFLGDLGYGK